MEKSAAKKHFNYKPQFGVIVLCKDERHQERIFNKLKKDGYNLKVIEAI